MILLWRHISHFRLSPLTMVHVVFSAVVFLLVRSVTVVIANKSIGAWEEETGFYQSITVTDKSPLITTISKYQKIEVHESKYYGKILVLDGVVQLTERDANSYNEMMAHVAMMQHGQPKRALVIGGGDGYVLSEVLKHQSLEHVDHVDLDNDVIEICKEHFSWGAAWSDPRVTLHIGDGAAFVSLASTGFYDVIIQDSSDPWTWDESGRQIKLPSSVLYAEHHFQNIYRILTDNGIFNFQSESFNIPSDLVGIKNWREQILRVGFGQARYGSLMVSSYTTGQIGFLLCEKNPLVAATMDEVTKRWETIQQIRGGTTYYQAKLQQSAFDLPLWVENAVYGVRGEAGDEL